MKVSVNIFIYYFFYQSLKQVLQLRRADLRTERLIIDAQTCTEKSVSLNKKKKALANVKLVIKIPTLITNLYFLLSLSM